jgi:hypothetical protein
VPVAASTAAHRKVTMALAPRTRFIISNVFVPVRFQGVWGWRCGPAVAL